MRQIDRGNERECGKQKGKKIIRETFNYCKRAKTVEIEKEREKD
jgi:hypothetical protein